MLNTHEGAAAALELSELGADAVRRGLVLASGGNLSARLDDEHFIVTGSGTWLDRLRPGDFSVMHLDGTVVSGNPKPSSEWKLHQRAYRARPDVNTVIHLHPQHAVLLASLGIEIRLITLDHAFYVGSIGVTPFYPNGSDELADTAAAQLSDHDCVVMQHHGCTVVGDSIEMTYRRAMNLEDAAKATALARQLGDTETRFPAEHGPDLHHA
ncbi:class II aldolase/adducin family protein [Leucobacter luti]|uniref:L-fuculose-phosphate aldolase n=1 Tax=Leucobacter luti TaxID=340320 RepID=A0A4R6RVT9_9MICO|nr:class II aldolase/adducin family protein [Leucobacter luti]MCW2289743.1 L-fuculose-phosphate aldolase [Leucobacter luti]QYM77098.1 class II aldolase/adducin family protein [Leucobacter luti]TCK34279.1 L-fuculose-phosphate aldolase [Leucobacter luti]TDP90904.1 L-fuculose-phosphate aldolase [Leucobacter luti]